MSELHVLEGKALMNKDFDAVKLPAPLPVHLLRHWAFIEMARAVAQNI